MGIAPYILGKAFFLKGSNMPPNEECFKLNQMTNKRRDWITLNNITLTHLHCNNILEVLLSVVLIGKQKG
jgi:hypothetical protein